MKKFLVIIAILVFVSVLFVPTRTYAVGKLEKVLLENPNLFRLVAFGVCILFGFVILVYNCFTGLGRTISLKRHVGAVEKEDAKRMRAYDHIPKGPVADYSLPPARLINVKTNKEYEVSSVQETTIGRSFENDIVVKRSSTSRHHAKIRPQKEGYVLYDLMSTSSTYVNMKKITERVLGDGDLIEIGKEDFMFRVS